MPQLTEKSKEQAAAEKALLKELDAKYRKLGDEDNGKTRAIDKKLAQHPQNSVVLHQQASDLLKVEHTKFTAIFSERDQKMAEIWKQYDWSPKKEEQYNAAHHIEHDPNYLTYQHEPLAAPHGKKPTRHGVARVHSK